MHICKAVSCRKLTTPYVQDECVAKHASSLTHLSIHTGNASVLCGITKPCHFLCATSLLTVHDEAYDTCSLLQMHLVQQQHVSVSILDLTGTAMLQHELGQQFT